MSIEKIRTLVNTVKKESINFTWVDDEIIELVIALADHIIKENTATSQSDKNCAGGVPKGYISIKEFTKEHPFIDNNTLSHYCSRFPEVSR